MDRRQQMIERSLRTREANLRRREKAMTNSQQRLSQLPDGAAETMEQDYEYFMSKRRDWFTYEAEALALLQGTNATDTIQIEADSNFILIELAQFSDIAAAAQTAATRVIPLVTVQITDTGSGRNLMANPIPIPSLFGDGQLPFILPHPRIFLRNSTIQIAFVNFDAAADYNVRLAFSGYKVYGTA